MNFLPRVVSLALRTGLMIVPAVLLLYIEQAVIRSPESAVHVPIVVKLRVYPSRIWAFVMSVVSFVRVGTMWSPAASVYAFNGSSVVHSNEPVLQVSPLVFASKTIWNLSKMRSLLGSPKTACGEETYPKPPR
jgi:hypothetical protein